MAEYITKNTLLNGVYFCLIKNVTVRFNGHNMCYDKDKILKIYVNGSFILVSKNEYIIIPF